MPGAPSSTTHVLASVSPSPSPSPSILDDRFGLLVTSDTRGSATTATVRSETSDRAIATFVSQGRSWTSLAQAVSPDGRSVAYWASVSDGPVLHVLPATGGADRVVFTGAKGMYGNAFAWSSDSSGLVVAIDNNCEEICPFPQVKELWTVDLASGVAEKVASGSFWIPVTWDRSAKLIAAGLTGPGGYLIGYYVLDLSTRSSRTTDFRPTVLGRLKASSDGTLILLLVMGQTTTISWWPLDAPQKRADVRGFTGTNAEWRPGTSEIWWAGTSGLVGLDVATGAQKSVAGSFGGIVGFRVDGSAAMTTQPSLNKLVVVDLKTGQGAMLPPGGPFVRVR